MKTWIDKLRELPRERLEQMITHQKAEIEIAKRDLRRMEEVLKEKDKVSS